MELKTLATGERRKQLVAEMVRYLQTAQTYTGVPDFAYIVGDYRIDCAGTVTGPYNRGLLETLAERGFSGEIVGVETEAEDNGGGNDVNGSCPVVAANSDGDNSTHTADADSDTLTPATTTDGGFVVEIPAEGFTPTALGNLDKLITSKRELIKAAIGAEGSLPVVQTTDGKLQFAWFPYTEDPDEINAYSTFVTLLCAAAKEQKRVTAKEKPVDNMKFAFRVLLLKSGMIGEEYKAIRRVLLRNLPGNSAYRDGTPRGKDVKRSVVA